MSRLAIIHLVDTLRQAEGVDTSMVSVYIPPSQAITRIRAKLELELSTSANIKDAVNRGSVQHALRSCLARLNLYKSIPKNGLAIFSGTIMTERGKRDTLTYHFEPPKEIPNGLYRCGAKFDTEMLEGMLDDPQKFGFIVVDGHSTQFAIMSGAMRWLVHKLTVSLPRKHGRGGQSALRFARLRMEARRNYVRKITELATEIFITNDAVNVAGLILAGSADFKNELQQSDLLDPRLKTKVLCVLDVAYGGENGLNQAMTLAGPSLGKIRLLEEEQLFDQMFDELARDTGKVAYGVQATMNALRAGAVDTLIVWDKLNLVRHQAEDGSEQILKRKVHETMPLILDAATADSAPVMLLLDWLAVYANKTHTNLQLVGGSSPKGVQFVRGFGGVAALLRYAMPELMCDDDMSDEDEASEASDAE